MAASSARPDALAQFADQLTTAADAVRPTLGQLRDALARVDVTCLDPRPNVPPVVEMTADVVGRDRELAASARHVGLAFAAADARSDVAVQADPGSGGDGGSGSGSGGSGLIMPALRLLLSLPDVDRIVRDGNPVDAWHDKGVGYVIDWAAVVSDAAMLTCQAVHHPYVCIGGPALRGATALLRWWESDTQLPGTHVRPHELEAGVVSAMHQGVDAASDIVHEGEAAVETTVDVGGHAAASATHGVERALHRGEKAIAHLADEGSKVVHQGIHAVDRLAHDLVPDLGFDFG